MYASVNALHEKLIGMSAPGGAELLFFPHDHAVHGGIPIGRNNVYTFDYCDDSNGWRVNCVAADTWYRMDPNSVDTAIEAPDISPPIAPGIACIAAYCTPGIDSTNDNVNSLKCKWEAQVLIQSDDVAVVSARFYNRNTKTYSGTKQTALTANQAWLEFSSHSAEEGIPCQGGVWNFLDLEISSSTTTNIVSVFSIVISETRRSSMPKSADTYKYSAAVKP
jgi:hypothetical protein